MRLNLHRGGDGPTLVLLHGIGSRWGMWEPVLPALQREFDVIALDMPGFGESPTPPPGTPPGIDSLRELVVASLRELGVQRFHVAGNSLGGLIALDLAHRGAVASACALSPAGFAGRAEAVLARAMLTGSVRAARLLAPHADALLTRPRLRTLLLSTFFAHPRRLPPRAAADDMRAMAGAPWFDETLPTVAPWDFPEGKPPGVPVTIAWGDKDRLLFPHQADNARRHLPHAEIVTLPDCGHQPTWDDPLAVAAVIRRTALST